MSVLARQRFSLALVSSLPLLPLVSSYPEVSDNQCDCYYTNASSANYFTSHYFFDFRSLSQYAKVPSPINEPDDDAQASPTSDYFSSDDWNDVWAIQNWNNSASVESGDAPTLMVNSANNIYIESNGDVNPASETYMTMRTLRQKEYQSAAEFQSVSQALHYLSVRMYARTSGPPGAVTAMFTYKDDGDPSDLSAVQESDLEIRTQDPATKIQYTNQPSYSSMGNDIPAATRNASTPAALKWTDWATYRMDWDSKATSWYMDGLSTASISFQVPRDPSTVIFNAWSDGGVWSGNMSVGKAAYMQIQWIEMVYNSSDVKAGEKRTELGSELTLMERSGTSCARICSIDDTTQIGTPVLIQSGTSRAYHKSLANSIAWIPLIPTTFLLL
ncbi:glycoside hydrolase family 16 protein [Xylariaceae sp. FL0255]|nr:glycoside hydrolase family 16 protein [Xylariaceae sp. FL0255]